MPSSRSPVLLSFVRAIETDTCMLFAFVHAFSARGITTAEPSLARPTCTIIESYSGRRWNHGRGLPGQGRDVVEPTVSKPKPTLSSSTGISQSLSRPADRPNGLAKSTPITLVSSIGSV